MQTAIKRITTNASVLNNVLTQYKDTFNALRELINNSIQAKATEINLNIEYNNAVSRSPIKTIMLIDNGPGVSYSEFENKILDVGTTVKAGGKGIGRFGALQIGATMEIETIAYDSKIDKYSKVFFNLNKDFIKNQLSETDLKVDYEYLDNVSNTYYKVTIKDLYHDIEDKPLKKNKITDKFKNALINQSIFELYPFEIFNDKASFTINSVKLKKSDFIIGDPNIKKLSYTTKKGRTAEVNFYFYNIKLDINKVKVFLLVENAGLKTVGYEYTYSSDWYTPDLGTWFIYVESQLFDSDLFRNLNIESLGEEEVKHLKDFIRETVNEFFKKKNKKFETFVQKLVKDSAYPYSVKQASSSLQEVVFKKAAYLIEGEHKLIENDSKIRNFLYPLLDKALSNGYIEDIFKKFLKLTDDGIEKFHSLLQKTDLEDVVHFTNQVTKKLEFLDFLHQIIYGDIGKVLKERSQLHKIIEKELWLFGEQYNETPILWSDKQIGNTLDELNEKYLVTKDFTSENDDESLIEVSGAENITDLFFFNEKILDSDSREVMIVELKSPKCAISTKELSQIDKYAYSVETHQGLPKERVKYKLIVISSKLSAFALSRLKSSREKYGQPFLYDKKTEKDIEVYAMAWSEIIELNKRKLSYLSNQLKIKDVSVKDKFETEYTEIISEKVASRLVKTK